MLFPPGQSKRTCGISVPSWDVGTGKRTLFQLSATPLGEFRELVTAVACTFIHKSHSVMPQFEIRQGWNPGAACGMRHYRDLPSAPAWDEACSSPADVAISGGAFAFSGIVLRESRPSVNTAAPGTSGAFNAWRVTCTDLTSKLDVACFQAYVVCLTHASQ